MVAAVSNPTTDRKTPSHNPKRPPLLPSYSENGAPRRPKSRDVSSRYLPSTSSSSATTSSSSSSASNVNAMSSSRRCASPVVSRATAPVRNAGSIKRSQSVERPRPMTPVPARDMSKAAKLLVASKRSLSVSFQGESFSMAISKAKPAPSPAVTNSGSVRKGTPERRKAVTPVRDRTENLKPTDHNHHRWPGRSTPANSNFMTKSMDFGGVKSKVGGSVNVVRSLQKAMIDNNSKIKVEAKVRHVTGYIEHQKKVGLVVDANLVSGSADVVASDTESVSSGSNSDGKEFESVTQVRGGPRGIVVPARFLQDTHGKRRPGPEPGLPMSRKDGLKSVVPPSLAVSRKNLGDSPVSSPRLLCTSRGSSSPLRGGVRPASPTRASSSPLTGGVRPASPSRGSGSLTPLPSRGMASPTRMRNGMGSMSSSNTCSTPSILCFTADVRRVKLGKNGITDAHELKLLYNRHVQWRFANARLEAALLLQTKTAKRSLYNAWVATWKLRDSVKSKKIELDRQRLNLKLHQMLKGHIKLLQDWDNIDSNHCSSLSGALHALEASTLRIPVVSGARADIGNVKDSISSAVDVMQAMASSICSLLPKVEQTNSLTFELANVSANERSSLEECNDILSTLIALQVKDCSFKTHTLQSKHVPSRLITEV